MHTKKPQLKHAAIPAAVALALGAAMAAGAAQAARVIISPEQVYSGSNFTMLDSGGGAVGGTNDVTGFWDGTAYNSQSDIPADLSAGTPNAVIQSPTKFFGFVWTAATVMVFAPGTYTFTEDNNTNTATWDTGGPSHTMTVAAGQLGAHMLFNWSSSHNIGVIDVWDKNAKFTPSALQLGGTVVTADPWSGNVATVWTLMSGLAADDPAHPNINGEPMVNGPFNGFNANFNLYAVDTGPTANNDACAVASPPASTACNVVANDVAQSGFAIDPATVVVESNPSRGTAVANANGTVTYTPASGVTAGTDSFTYTVRDNSTVGYNETTLVPDGKGLRSNLATVTVDIGAPSASADSKQTPQGIAVVVDVLANDSPSAGATLNAASVTVVTAPAVGSASANATNGKITYTPDPSFTGLVTFKYTVADSDARVSSPATVTVQVQGTGIGSSVGAVSAGTVAASQGLTSGRMTASQLTAAGVPTDPGVVMECVGGCFDFKLSSVTAPTASVVLKLSARIPTNPEYRKWNGNKWVDFSTTAPNALFSAPRAKSGNCPAAGDAAYTTGLQAGNRCVELVIQDNGPNDQDMTIGAIADPGGVAQLPTAGAAVQVTPTPPSVGGGCSLAATDGSPWHGGSWWLIGAVIGWLGFNRRRRSPQQP